MKKMISGFIAAMLLSCVFAYAGGIKTTIHKKEIRKEATCTKDQCPSPKVCHNPALCHGKANCGCN